MGIVRLGSALKEKVQQVAAIKGLTLSEVHRLALTAYYEREMAQKKTSRLLTLAERLSGDRDFSVYRLHGKKPSTIIWP